MKEIYWFSGYIPSDENIVCITIRKIVRLQGEKKRKYLWINVNTDGGIGTLLDFDEMAYDTVADALLAVYNFNDGGIEIVKKYNFEDMFKKYLEIKEVLTEKLNKE